MSGQGYLEDIRTELQLGRHQHRMGENVLRAFGYIRRRATAIQEINEMLDKLGLVADPPISLEMPLRTPRTRFSLRGQPDVSMPEGINASVSSRIKEPEIQPQDVDESDDDFLEPAFSVSELRSANKLVECISADASIDQVYTKMVLNKYSQVVVASNVRPRQQDIKGIVSFQSMTKAMMNGKVETVGDCIDKNVPCAQVDDDLKSVITQLSENDVVLVIGRDKRLQGIVTAWDLAEEFAMLVDPFKRIGEIEARLRVLVRKQLGKERVVEFLKEYGLSGDDPAAELDELTMGELEKVLDFPQHWETLNIPYNRSIFIEALKEARGYRNRLMHFREPLNEDEMTQLTNICDMVREIPTVWSNTPDIATIYITSIPHSDIHDAEQ